MGCLALRRCSDSARWAICVVLALCPRLCAGRACTSWIVASECFSQSVASCWVLTPHDRKASTFVLAAGGAPAAGGRRSGRASGRAVETPLGLTPGARLRGRDRCAGAGLRMGKWTSLGGDSGGSPTSRSDGSRDGRPWPITCAHCRVTGNSPAGRFTRCCAGGALPLPRLTVRVRVACGLRGGARAEHAGVAACQAFARVQDVRRPCAGSVSRRQAPGGTARATWKTRTSWQPPGLPAVRDAMQRTSTQRSRQTHCTEARRARAVADCKVPHAHAQRTRAAADQRVPCVGSPDKLTCRAFAFTCTTPRAYGLQPQDGPPGRERVTPDNSDAHALPQASRSVKPRGATAQPC